jgi:tetratricopeptide (TPR) repeat protein
MNLKIILFSLFTLLTFPSWGSADQAWRNLVQSKGDYRSYPSVVRELVKDNLYFVAIPYIKEYLTRGSGSQSKKIDGLIDTVITYVGVRQFEVLPINILKKSKAPIIRYILAKKYFRYGKYSQALRILNQSIPTGHTAKPFALFLEASIHTMMGKHKRAIETYRSCITKSKKRMNLTSLENRLKQLSINRDYCIVGIGRSHFASGKYEEANLAYLDLSKDSFVWPEILFEEAWSSFYERDFNRTLGKLVTYKAPIMGFIFNPEIDVLNGLTYMELCHWDDAKKVVEDFYNSYDEDFLSVKRFLRRHAKNYKYFYLLSKTIDDGKNSGNKLLDKLIKAISNDPTYKELVDNFTRGKEEIEKIGKITKGRSKAIFKNNLKSALTLQRDLIGAYVRKSLHLYIDQLEKSFEGMSYIKLEVLSRWKNEIYNIKFRRRSRGDIKNLVRNEKQYFWTFNGEFWADELGDYVFSLKSKCDE